MSDTGITGLTEQLPPGTEKSLADIKLLKHVDAAAVSRLEEICTWLFCAKDGFVFDSDDDSGDVFFIVSGSVRASDNVDSETEVAFVDLGAGDIIGELSAIDNGGRARRPSTPWKIASSPWCRRMCSSPTPMIIRTLWWG